MGELNVTTGMHHLFLLSLMSSAEMCVICMMTPRITKLLSGNYSYMKVLGCTKLWMSKLITSIYSSWNGIHMHVLNVSK